ncbi:MAG: alkane 1-monooxygenase [Chitinophagaceae bacterium]
MQLRAYKYLAPFLLYLGSIQAFFGHGFLVWIPMIYAWVLIPLVELFTKPNEQNLSKAEEEMARKEITYDLLLYAVFFFQYTALFCFLYNVSFVAQSTADLVGKIAVMGLLCGTFGINVGHELGHRVNKVEQTLAKALLLTSLYMHFFIEHNRGHHKRVATPEDPSSARYGEPVYAFYFRTIVLSYLSAWSIANRDIKKKGYGVVSLHNEMIQIHLIQTAFVVLTGMVFGWMSVIYFVLAALQGILLLETVNYIEHYGLQRKQIAAGKWERAMPEHSWNSNHVLGRIMLFELSRHSDHHYLASRKYQILRHHQHAPQMPTGYPGMMILSLVPPLWFYVMNKRVTLVEHKKSVFTETLV